MSEDKKSWVFSMKQLEYQSNPHKVSKIPIQEGKLKSRQKNENRYRRLDPRIRLDSYQVCRIGLTSKF